MLKMYAGYRDIGIIFTVVSLGLVQSEEKKWYRMDGHHLKVSTILIEPYMMARPHIRNGTGNHRYYGYMADLLEHLAKVVGFRYEITEVTDKSYGYKQSDGSWSGMVGQLVRQEVDVAAGPLYITEPRKRVVSFTTPFINVQATLLLRKPPASGDLTVKSVGDLISQSEIKYGTLEKGIIVRAFKQTNVTSLKIMLRQMNRFEPSVYTSTNEEGIAKVRDEKYAFILPDTIGEYIAQQPPCDLVTLDKFLMSKGYGLALQKQPFHLSREEDVFKKINKGMRILRKKHVFDQLRRKWWVEKSVCHGIIERQVYFSPNTGASSLRLNRIGIVVLIVILYTMNLLNRS